jgi:hypothetical protein
MDEATNTQQAPINDWSNANAFKIAHANFQHAERYKQQNCERRYREAMRLFLAATTRKNWEGTKVARSAMPVYLALQQIEALLPHVIGTLFNGEFPVDARPFPGTNPDQARAALELIRWQLLWLDPQVGPVPFISLRELFRRGYKSDLIFGNQIMEVGWSQTERKYMRYDKMLVPKRQLAPSPTGGVFMAPTGEYDIQAVAREETQTISKPIARNVDIRDFFWDPNCPSQCIQEGRYAAHRQFPTVTELMQYSGQPGFETFTEQDLLALAKKRSQRPADSSKAMAETYRGNNWNPMLEYNDNPALCRLEVVRYSQADRIVWIVPNADENAVLYNAPNEYGFINFLTSSYTDVPGRWDGLSICDLVEGDQHLAMSILDARIDELNLIVHPPIIWNTQMSAPSSPSQKRLRPGAEWKVSGPWKEAVGRLEMGNVTAQAFVEVDALERRSQKTTGVTDTAVIGAPSAGGNSALRTATGVSSLSNAAGTRIEYQVENKQDHILVPLVYMIHWLNRRFLDPAQAQAILGPDGAQLTIDNSDVMNAEVMFEWQAGSRRRTKQALQSGGLQMVLQSTLNAPLIQALAAQGVKPDYMEVAHMIGDALDRPGNSLFVKMTPEEMQAHQQQSQLNDLMVKMQMQTERIKAQDERSAASDENKLLIELLKKLITPDAAHGMLGMPPASKIAAMSQPKQLPPGERK